MPAPLILRIIGDVTSLLKANESAVASNTKVGESALKMGADYGKAADAQIAAAVKARKAMEANVAALAAAQKGLTGRDAATAAVVLENAQGRLNRSMGITTTTLGRAGQESQNTEREFGKLTRGVLAGSGAAASLGRSLAFASGGFIALAAGASLVADSIRGAEALDKAQRSLAVAIQHTGGNLKELEPEYAATAKSAAQFGINQADATTALARATVLTGNAAAAQRAYQEALVISKATGKDFNIVLTATAKGQEGVTTSLQRYGIMIAKGTPGTKQFADVMARFAGQARANTTETQRFTAELQNTEAVVGAALLPTFDKYLGELGDWLTKMTATGRLQRDVNEVLHVGGDIFKAVGVAIGGVDKVTGGFANTLKVLAAFGFSRLVAGWLVSLDALAVKWGLVSAAATAAGTAEASALGAGGLAAAAGGAATISARTARNLPSVFGEYAGAGEIAAVGGAAAIATTKVASLRSSLLGLAGKTFITTLVLDEVLTHQGFLQSKAGALAGQLGATQPNPANPSTTSTPGPLDFFRHPLRTFMSSPALNDAAAKVAQQIYDAVQAQITKALSTGHFTPSFFPKIPGFGAQATQGPFGAAQPMAQWSSFTLTMMEQINQAKATLTKGTQDDVTVAKQIISRIKRLVDQGNLSDKAYLQALQAWGAALGTIQSAQQAAAQKRAAAAAQALQEASTYSTPTSLQIAQVEAEFTKSTKDDARALRGIIADAKKALASGKKNAEGRLAALQVELQAVQALQGLQGQSATTYTLPAKLQLALAKAQAEGQPIVPVLLKMKAALERALKAAKGNIQKQTDIYNQIYGINQQLNQGVTDAYGDFKQANLKALTADLGLTPDQRRALEQRYARVGPGGTVPSGGTTAGGYIIDPATGRPIHLHRPGHVGSTYTGPGGGRPTPNVTTVDLNVYIDGKHVEAVVTPRQQRTRRRNPTSRRGPNTATAAA